MLTAVLLLGAVMFGDVAAQQVACGYKVVSSTVYEKQPVKMTRLIQETVMEKRPVTTYKMIWQAEARERRHSYYQPIQETGFREEKQVLYSPVVETLYRDKQITETSYKTVTEYRDEQIVVRKPIVETEMREVRTVVSKPVVETLIEVTSTTTYQPVAGVQTLMSLRPFAQQTYVPVTVETRKPVQITRYVDQVETTQVPTEVNRVLETVETRRVPYQVQRPVVNVRTERIPYTQTTCQETTIVKKVPYTETTYQRVDTVEPYDVQVPRWVAVTEDVETPKVVTRRVEYEAMQDVPKTVFYRIPIDAYGNEIGPAELIESGPTVPVSSNVTEAVGTTLGQTGSGLREVRKRPAVSGNAQPLSFKGKLERLDVDDSDDTITKEGLGKSILVPVTDSVGSGLKAISRELAGGASKDADPAKRTEETSGRIPSEDDDRGGNDEPQEPVVTKPDMPQPAPSETGDENAGDLSRDG